MVAGCKEPHHNSQRRKMRSHHCSRRSTVSGTNVCKNDVIVRNTHSGDFHWSDGWSQKVGNEESLDEFVGAKKQFSGRWRLMSCIVKSGSNTMLRPCLEQGVIVTCTIFREQPTTLTQYTQWWVPASNSHLCTNRLVCYVSKTPLRQQAASLRPLRIRIPFNPTVLLW